MTMSELKKKTDVDLRTQVAELRETARQIRFGVSGNIKNTRALRDTKKEIARIMTELSLREADRS